MCGILAIIGQDADDASVSPQKRAQLIRRSRRLRHRGPDGTGVAVVQGAGGACFMAHERLNIVDTSELGTQPQQLSLECGGKVTWMCNGEIYNHASLRKEELAGVEIRGNSDCAVIGHLYVKYGAAFVDKLDGVFALAVFDSRSGSLLVARDAMGISPCYYGQGSGGSMYFASEMKAIHDVDGMSFKELPPGHYMTCNAGEAATTDNLLCRWYTPRWITDEAFVPSGELCLQDLKKTVIDAVVKRRMTDVPFGVLRGGTSSGSV